MAKVIRLGVVLAIALAVFVVFVVWKPLAGWTYADVLPDVQAEYGDAGEVIAIESSGSGSRDVAFVLRGENGDIITRHYWHGCLWRNEVVRNGNRLKGSCALTPRKTSTTVRRESGVRHGPVVRLGDLTPGAIGRLERDGGKAAHTGAVLWKGRWHFDAPGPAEASTAAPDGSDAKRVAPYSTINVERNVHALVGSPKD